MNRQILEQHWFVVCASTTLKHLLLTTKIFSIPLVVSRTAQGVQAWIDVCPHRGVSLSMGKRKGELCLDESE
ncbi:Rieske 2Fe-2S domain-containing protein [Hazenella sp. IB182353]|uniref:Rieske 2Fe-2S domain-containing protein n=1 Tax=Polycladospora coralii TaxID=2771432 RepID=UPI001747CDE7|nr:Rieske 2Fe-2S domain-containing protein [Polycladospora coralii]MBS7532017.1 Rieske 2Fe-2S domain-containing protein [Polycladospora coralii]